jgi:hypothetical protein
MDLQIGTGDNADGGMNEVSYTLITGVLQRNCILLFSGEN